MSLDRADSGKWEQWSGYFDDPPLPSRAKSASTINEGYKSGDCRGDTPSCGADG